MHILVHAQSIETQHARREFHIGRSRVEPRGGKLAWERLLLSHARARCSPPAPPAVVAVAGEANKM